LSAEVLKILIVKKEKKLVFCNRKVWKWFGLTSFEAKLLFWGWVLNNWFLIISHSKIIYRRNLLRSLRLVSVNHY